MFATMIRAAAIVVAAVSLFAAADPADAAAPTSCGTKGSNREAKLGKGSGEDLLVVGNCAVSDPGTYKYADVNIVVVPGFVVTPGIGFRHGDGNALSAIPAGDNWGGYLRTQFTF